MAFLLTRSSSLDRLRPLSNLSNSKKTWTNCPGSRGVVRGSKSFSVLSVFSDCCLVGLLGRSLPVGPRARAHARAAPRAAGGPVTANRAARDEFRGGIAAKRRRRAAGLAPGGRRAIHFFSFMIFGISVGLGGRRLARGGDILLEGFLLARDSLFCSTSRPFLPFFLPAWPARPEARHLPMIPAHGLT